MKIRNATPQDIPRIMSIWNPFIRDDHVTFSNVLHTHETLNTLLRDKIDRGHAFLVVELQDIVQGFAYYSQFRGGVGYAYTFEHTVYVSSDAKGAGLGRALVLAIEDHARSCDGHSIFAGISAKNTAAIAFHRRIGYSEVAQIKQAGWKFGRWHDLTLMQKFL